MNVPTIGGPKGIFETFLPGVFLLLNLGVAILLFPFCDGETKQFIDIGSNPILLLVIVIGFGYLFGVLLRLLQTNLPDKLSAAWLRRFRSDARLGDNEYELWATEDFPYIGWIEQTCERYLPPESQSFHNKIWGDRKRDDEQNRPFFNFCKMMIYSEDEKSANEIYAAEALCRYISGMFYALVFSIVLLFDIFVLQCAFSGQIVVGLMVILCAYLCALIVILSRFRFMRIKEAETVFVASFKNRSIFEGMIETADKG